MSQQEYYSIGEMSKATNISQRMLRHYESIQLVIPAYKSESSYRYYTREQIYDLLLIKKLQIIGFTLNEIQSLFKSADGKVMAQEIRGKLDALHEKIETLTESYMAGERMLDKLQKDEASRLFMPQEVSYNSDIREEDIPEYQVLFKRVKIGNFHNEDIPVDHFCDLFRVAEKERLTTTGSILFTYHTEAPLEQFFKTECDLEMAVPVLPAQDGAVKINGIHAGLKTFGGFHAAVTEYFGEYESISSAHLSLLKWINEHGFRLNGVISEECLVSPFDLNHQGRFVTKIMAPITTK